jgi:catechol-2,3-dioxygenase
MEDTNCIVPAKFAHFVLRTPRFEEMMRWYQTVLGAKVQFANAMIAFLTYDDEHHRLALISMPGLADAGTTAGLDHVAYTYASMGDLLATYKRLKEAGIKPVWCVNHGPTTSMYYRDPDGNRVELQIDNFPTVEALNAWFHSGAFARNPIGVKYDPDRLVQKFESGVPVQELILQGAV